MTDRQPTYPGRVTLTPVEGQTNKYDMVMADEPTDVGTPPIKANLLSDAAAALINALTGTTPETPNDAFSEIVSALSDVTTLANSKSQITTGSYTGTGTYGSGSPNTLTFSFVPKLVIVFPEFDVTSSTLAPMIAVNNATQWSGYYYYNGTPPTTAIIHYQWTSNTFSWWNSAWDAGQFNKSGIVYHYIAIG